MLCLACTEPDQSLEHPEYYRLSEEELARHGKEPEALLERGMRLWCGIGVQTNEEAAWSEIYHAANSGHPVALALCLKNAVGVEDSESNCARALELFSQSAGRNHPVALTEYGYLLETGEGVDRDIERAVRMYFNASSQGYIDALYRIAACARNHGEDDALAFQRFKMAAFKGHSWGMYRLAEHYEHGVGVEANRQKAAHFYELAKMLGYEQPPLKQLTEGDADTN